MTKAQANKETISNLSESRNRLLKASADLKELELNNRISKQKSKNRMEKPGVRFDDGQTVISELTLSFLQLASGHLHSEINSSLFEVYNIIEKIGGKKIIETGAVILELKRFNGDF